MSGKKKEFLLNMLAGAIISVLVFILNFSRGYELARCFCDGFFVAAAMLLGVGGIKGVRNKGTFDVIGFGLRSALETAIPMLRHGEKEDIEQYRQRKAKERRGASPMLIAGAVYLVLSFAALGIYHIAA